MSDPQQRELHLLDYWRVLNKRRWVVYTSLIVLVSTVTLGSFLKRPIYTATTRLQIERSMPNVLPFQEVMSSAPDWSNDFYQTQYGLIRSRRVAGEVIASLELARHAEFSVKGALDAEPGEFDDGALQAQRIEILLKNLGVAPVRNSRLVDVSYASHDPLLAARVANRVAETYISLNTAVQYNTTARATTTLTHQIANLQEQIDARELELQSYARKHGIVELGDQQNIAMKDLSDLSDSYTGARAARIQTEARFASLKRSGPDGVSEVLQSRLIQDLTAKSAELGRRYAQLSDKFKPEWPEMVRLQSEIDETRIRLSIERQAIYEQVVGVAESAYQSALAEEQQLKTTLDEEKHRMQAIEVEAIQYNNLKAEIANKRATIEALLKRQAETGSSAGLPDPGNGNVRIVDIAEVPTNKSSPKIAQNILMSLFTGLILGIGLAFFFEYLDKSVKSPEEIRATAGIPSIGVVPSLRPERSGLRMIRSHVPGEGSAASVVELVSHHDPKSNLAEAFREIRTTLLVSQAGGPPAHILITSSQPGEGKTALTVNLGITLAQIGRRVLLVDTDLRRPRLHKILRATNSQGLTGYLSASGRPWPEPQRTEISGLDLIPSGPLPPNPADLLDSDRFGQVQREFREQGYDHVIYDSPPVLAVADPAIMAGRMDAVIMVVHAGNTTRDALALAVKKLLQVRAPILGAVLNRVNAHQAGYYEGYSYTRYYGEGERPTGISSARKMRRPDRHVQI